MSSNTARSETNNQQTEDKHKRSENATQEERDKVDDKAKLFGLGGEFGEHGKLNPVDDKRERLAGGGDHIGTHDPTSMLDKKDKEVVHDVLLGVEDGTHMPYLS